MLHGPDRGTTEKGGFLVLLALVTVALLWIVQPFASALLFAGLAAIMFQPLFNHILVRRPEKRNSAAAATLLIITFAVIVPAVVLASVVLEQAATIVVAFREGRIDPVQWLVQMRDSLPEFVRTLLARNGWDDIEALQLRAQTLLSESAGVIASYAVAIGGGALSLLLSIGVGLYITFFLLRDGRHIGRAFIIGLPVEREIADRLAERFLSIVRATVKGTLVVGIVQGILGGLTFWIVGIPSAALFGVLMGLFSLIPAVGPAIVWIPAAVWLLASGDVWQGLVVIGSGVGIIGLADNLLRPMLVGRDTGIPDWIILVSTLGGIAVLGFSGIVIGPLIAGLFLASWSILREMRETDTHNHLEAEAAASAQSAPPSSGA